jgi:hypothetical protein
MDRKLGRPDGTSKADNIRERPSRSWFALLADTSKMKYGVDSVEQVKYHSCLSNEEAAENVTSNELCLPIIKSNTVVVHRWVLK